jgi:uncharacterized protein GlcG (DUF336 family)
MRRALIAGSIVAAMTLLVAGCSGSGNSGSPVGTAPPPPAQGDSGCTGSCVTASSFLTRDEVGRILAQAVAEAQAQNARATIAVVDRVGNPLAVYRMTGARITQLITSNRGVRGGLEGLNVPSELAAISKAVTGAYLSSEGNAFSSRTASQIVQQHFNPGESNAPSGPLFGVQFSQLVCSDLVQLPAATLAALNVAGARTVGPKPAPLGLSADPGGLPLYKGGTVVGGIGVAADEQYTLDPSVNGRDTDLDEAVATAGTFGFAAPLDREGDRITADGKTFRFNDLEFSDLARDPATAPAFGTLTSATGGLIAAPFFFAGTGINEGVAFTTAASGYVADTQDYPGLDAFVLVGPDGQPRFRPRAGTDGSGGLTATEVRELLRQAIGVANAARAQIRRPTDSQMRVTVSVVDTNGAILGVARTRDAPIFGTDVSLQKARAAAFFSGAFAASEINALPDAVYVTNTAAAPGTLTTVGTVRLGSYVTASRNFFGIPTFLGDGQFAITPRAIGLIARPFFPDGIVGTANGPLSKPFADWSPFSVGIQLDLAYNQIGQILVGYLTQNAAPIVALRPTSEGGGGLGCTRNPRLANGIQIFPGASPVFRGDRLVGAVGVSGDGIDQDDMVSFLGTFRAGQQLGSIGHAPANRRIDQLAPQGSRLRYVQCPQGPFLGSTAQNVCEGI